MIEGIEKESGFYSWLMKCLELGNDFIASQKERETGEDDTSLPADQQRMSRQTPRQTGCLDFPTRTLRCA